MAERLTFHVGGTDLKMLNYGLDAIWRKKLKHDRYDVILRAVDRLAAYEDLGTVEELAELKEATTDAWLQLRTATFSTNKGAADLAKFILSILPEAPKEGRNV